MLTQIPVSTQVMLDKTEAAAEVSELAAAATSTEANGVAATGAATVTVAPAPKAAEGLVRQCSAASKGQKPAVAKQGVGAETTPAPKPVASGLPKFSNELLYELD